MDYFEVYREIWQFHKQYIDRICNEDEFWEAVIADADKLHKKYDNSRFAKDLILAELTEFERISKEEKTQFVRVVYFQWGIRKNNFFKGFTCNKVALSSSVDAKDRSTWALSSMKLWLGPKYTDGPTRHW